MRPLVLLVALALAACETTAVTNVTYVVLPDGAVALDDGGVDGQALDTGPRVATVNIVISAGGAAPALDAAPE